MINDDFGRLQVSKAGSVATISINNPPVNVLDVPLMTDIRRLLLSLRDDPTTRVLVFQSADPEFFIAHVDMN
ncbi:enoyl-CoA hydratase-related protein [Bradyrhizobium sp. 18BD]